MLTKIQQSVVVAEVVSTAAAADVPAAAALAYETLLSLTTVGDASGGTSRRRTCVVAGSVAVVAEGLGAAAAYAGRRLGVDGGALAAAEVSPALENVALVADSSSPPDSMRTVNASASGG